MSAGHAHKYVRMDIGRKRPWLIFKCIAPRCRHFTPIRMAIGNEATCWGCHQRFIMSKYNLKQTKPKCRSCTQSIEAQSEAVETGDINLHEKKEELHQKRIDLETKEVAKNMHLRQDKEESREVTSTEKEKEPADLDNRIDQLLKKKARLH